MTKTGDVGACLGQPDRDGLADAAAGAGDQRDIAIQLEKIHRVSSLSQGGYALTRASIKRPRASGVDA